ncbi:MAG: hypothetical protein K2Q26_06425 [Bdellovibrionales bacterium]|nr:hypothetical protein [Bdellovibrionales bacterium]
MKIALTVFLFFVAACGKHSSVNSAFLDNSNSFQGNQNKTDEEKLIMAIDVGNEAAFDGFLADVDDLNRLLTNGRTYLIHATIQNRARFVWKLLQKGADVSVLDSLGKTAIDHAQDNPKMWNLLDSDRQKEQQENFFTAVENEDTLGLQKMLEEQVNPNFLHASGQTPLTRAVQLKSLPVVRTISRWKDKDGINTIDLALPNGAGESALGIAKEKNIKKIIDELVKNGAIVESVGVTL